MDTCKIEVDTLMIIGIIAGILKTYCPNIHSEGFIEYALTLRSPCGRESRELDFAKAYKRSLRKIFDSILNTK